MPDCSSPGRWRAGVATVDITPAMTATSSVPMGCFPIKPPHQVRLAEGVHDPLLATALALGVDDAGLILVAVDVPMIRREQLKTVRQLVAQRDATVPVERIILAASHTHHSLDTCYVFGTPRDHPRLVVWQEQLAQVIVQAWRQREAVTLETGFAGADLAHNRRVLSRDGKWGMVYDRQPGVTTGPTDPQTAVWLLRRHDGSPLALLFQYAAHALAIGPRNRLFTADFPGRARQVIAAQLPGVTPLFVNGAAGDVHPYRSMKEDFSAVEEVGVALGQAVAEAVPALMPLCGQGLQFAARTLSFPNRMDPTLTVEVELQAARLGDWLLLTVPGEYFVEFQLQLKQALAPMSVLLIGYANDWPGYIPTRQAFAQGGYGVDPFPNDPPQYSRTALPPGAGEAIYTALLQLAQQVSHIPEEAS